MPGSGEDERGFEGVDVDAAEIGRGGDMEAEVEPGTTEDGRGVGRSKGPVEIRRGADREAEISSQTLVTLSHNE